MLHDRLFAWIALSDRAQQRDAYGTLFTSDATIDADLHCENTVRGRIRDGYAPLEDIRPIVGTSDTQNGVVVFEARDPVTNMWHRVSWAFRVRDALIAHVVETTSQGLPSPEERGRMVP